MRQNPNLGLYFLYTLGSITMHVRIRKTPRLADDDMRKLELWTFMDIYPCPHKHGAPNR
jgi:hypothetical protein